jgi:hypothetical protein
MFHILLATYLSFATSNDISTFMLPNLFLLSNSKNGFHLLYESLLKIDDLICGKNVKSHYFESKISAVNLLPTVADFYNDMYSNCIDQVSAGGRGDILSSHVHFKPHDSQTFHSRYKLDGSLRYFQDMNMFHQFLDELYPSSEFDNVKFLFVYDDPAKQHHYHYNLKQSKCLHSILFAIFETYRDQIESISKIDHKIRFNITNKLRNSLCESHRTCKDVGCTLTPILSWNEFLSNIYKIKNIQNENQKMRIYRKIYEQNNSIFYSFDRAYVNGLVDINFNRIQLKNFIYFLQVVNPNQLLLVHQNTLNWNFTLTLTRIRKFLSPLSKDGAKPFTINDNLHNSQSSDNAVMTTEICNTYNAMHALNVFLYRQVFAIIKSYEIEFGNQFHINYQPFVSFDTICHLKDIKDLLVGQSFPVSELQFHCLGLHVLVLLTPINRFLFEMLIKSSKFRQSYDYWGGKGRQ